MKHLKEYNSFKGINESFWSSIFGKATVKDAADTALKGQGFSHTRIEDGKLIVSNPAWSL